MINILVAHQGEATPFIDHYQLRRQSAGGLTLYGNCFVRLLVMGQGSKNVKKSLGKLVASQDATAKQWWINFGLAGSAEFPVGTLVTIDQIGWQQAGSQQQSVSMPVADLPVCGCLSRASPATNYPLHGVVDMEASTVIEVLAKAGKVNKTGLFKLVSDGPDAPVESLTPSLARACVERSTNAICRACDDFIASIETRTQVACEHP